MLNLGGQIVGYNPERKITRFEIKEPFMRAGHILNWDLSKYGSVGIGLNKEIIKHVTEKQCHLIVRVDSQDHSDYWLYYDKLIDFIKNNNTEYLVSQSKYIHVIPWKICVRFQPKVEAN